MHTWNSRAGRRPLAITIATLLALTSLAACSDEPAAPKHLSTRRAVAERDIPTLSSDSTLVTFDVAREGKLFSNGYVGVTTTFTCSRNLAELFTVKVVVQQDQKGAGPTSSGQWGLTCMPGERAAGSGNSEVAVDLAVARFGTRA